MWHWTNCSYLKTPVKKMPADKQINLEKKIYTLQVTSNPSKQVSWNERNHFSPKPLRYLHRSQSVLMPIGWIHSAENNFLSSVKGLWILMGSLLFIPLLIYPQITCFDFLNFPWYLPTDAFTHIYMLSCIVDFALYVPKQYTCTRIISE